MAWRPGDVVLGLYEVRDVVHSGAMGLVHRVHHLGWQVDLAVKTPRPGRMRPAEFEAEAEAWVGLGLHPHTVSCAYVRTIDGVPRVFAEWVDGGSLKEAVRSGSLYAGGGEVALGRVLDVAVQMAWGLGHAHAKGLVHQDVKPANVMLQPDGTAKVTDFGLAKVWAGERAEDAPPTVTFAGMTAAYCSPEQASDHPRLTAATDVWSWAVTVLELFVGRRLVDHGPAAGHAMDLYLRQGGEIPDPVVDLLHDCFADDPADRPADLGDVAARLREIHRELLGTEHPRPVPRAARLLADGLSNHALSLLDLGRAEEAELLWQQAAGADPHHLPTVYNYGLFRWRAGRSSGEQVVADLEAARAAEIGAPPGWGALQLGAVHLERHDDDRAAALLREADPGSPDVVAALDELRSRPPQVHADVDTRIRELSRVAVSRDGGVVLFGDAEGRLGLWSPSEQRTRKALRTLTRRGGEIRRLAVTDDGRLGVVARAGAVELWDLERGRRRTERRLEEGASPVTAVAVSPDGRAVVTGHANGHVLVWRDELVLFRDLWTQSGSVTSVGVSADGSKVVSASIGHSDRPGRVHSLLVDERAIYGELPAPDVNEREGTTRVPAIVYRRDAGAVSADGSYAVAAWSGGPLEVWDGLRGTVVSEVPHHLPESHSFVVAGTTVITTGDADDPIEVWDGRTGQCLRELSSSSHRAAVAISSDGRLGVVGRRDGTLSLRSLPVPGYRAPWRYVKPRAVDQLARAEDVFTVRLQEFRDLAERRDYPAAIEVLRSIRQLPGFSRNADLRWALAEIGRHGRRAGFIGVWPLYHVEGHGEFTQPATAAVRTDGVFAATARWTGHVDVWDVATADRAYTFEPGEGGMAREIEFTPDGSLLIVRTNVGTIRRLSLVDGSRRLFTDEMGRITAYALSGAGDRILIGDETGTLRLRDLPAGNILATTSAHDGGVESVALSRDGRFAASIGGPRDDYHLQLWPVDSEGPKWTESRGAATEQVDFGASGRVLILSQGLITTVWDVQTGEFRYSLRDRSVFLGRDRLGLSADGELAVKPHDGGLLVWAPWTGERVQFLPLEDPAALAMSADGTFVVGAGLDRVIRIWDVRSGQCLRTLPGHRERIDQLVLSRDGNILVSTDLGSGKHVWELAWDFDFPPSG